MKPNGGERVGLELFEDDTVSYEDSWWWLPDG